MKFKLKFMTRIEVDNMKILLLIVDMNEDNTLYVHITSQISSKIYPYVYNMFEADSNLTIIDWRNPNDDVNESIQIRVQCLLSHPNIDLLSDYFINFQTYCTEDSMQIYRTWFGETNHLILYVRLDFMQLLVEEEQMDTNTNMNIKKELKLYINFLSSYFEHILAYVIVKNCIHKYTIQPYFFKKYNIYLPQCGHYLNSKEVENTWIESVMKTMKICCTYCQKIVYDVNHDYSVEC